MPEVFSLASGEKRSSERVVLVGERPLAQAVKSFEHNDPITLPFISPESRFDPGNVIGWLKKRFLKGLLLVKCAMILAKPVLPLVVKVLTSLHDSCSSQMNIFYSLHGLALTRMSFRDFPLRYEMMGGSLKIFLSCG